MIIATILISATFLLGALVLHAMYMHAELKGYERGLDEAEEIMREVWNEIHIRNYRSIDIFFRNNSITC